MTPARPRWAIPALLRFRRHPILLAAVAIALPVASAAAYPLMPHVAPRSGALRPLSVRIVRHPAAYSPSSTATFAWRQVSGTRSMCRLDAKTFVRCSKKITYKKLKAGKHTFRVRVYRGKAYKTATSAWVIDLTPPTAPTVAGGSPSWVTAPLTLAASGSTDVGTGVAGYQHRELAEGAAHWTSAAAGTSVKVAGNGVTWVQFRAVDKAGNVSAWAPQSEDAASTVELDDTPPTLPVLVGGAATWVNAPQVTVTAAGSVDALSDPVSYRYSLDGGQTWTTGSAADVTSQGKTTVEFESIDALGNTSSPVSTPVWIDRTPPTDPTVAGGQAAWQSASSVTLTASASSDPVSGMSGYQYETSLNGGPLSAPHPGSSVTISAEGQTTVQFQAISKSGLVSNWVPSVVWLDRTAPAAPTLSGGSAGWQDLPSIAIIASGGDDPAPGSGLAGYQYETSTNGGSSWSAPATGATATVAAEGDTLVRFRAVDALGHLSTWAQASAMIDRTPPTDPVITGVPSGWVSSSYVTARASSTDSPGSGIDHYWSQISLDGGLTWLPAAGSSSVTVTGEGQTLVRFQAVDNSGLTSGWSVATISIDRTPPLAVPDVSGGSNGWAHTSPFTVTASGAIDPASGGNPGSGIDHYQYRTSTNAGRNWSAAADGASDAVSAQGETIVQFRAVDAAGNAVRGRPPPPAARTPSRSTRRRPVRPPSAAARWRGRRRPRRRSPPPGRAMP